jgi:hypothetical protein
MRRLVVLLIIAAACAWAPASAAALPEIDVECNGSPTCEGIWFTSPVFVHWTVSGATEPLQGCNDITIDKDTPGDPQGCIAKGGGTKQVTVVVSLDQTPPIISGAVPDRPPDHAGWYSRPVTFAVQATDATSQLAGCDGPSYGGPDSANATVVATCRDKAGNSASRAFPLSYDATPPDLTGASVATGDRVVRLAWPAGASATLMRTPGSGESENEVVYEGPGAGFTDREVRNGRRYRYVLTLTDQAGNAASRELSGVPDRRLLAPARRATVAGPPLLDWTAVRGARYYNVQLFRGDRKILSAWPTRSKLQLRARWRFRGKRRHLVPGVYRWYVWPGLGRRAEHRYGEEIGGRSFVVTAVESAASGRPRT